MSHRNFFLNKKIGPEMFTCPTTGLDVQKSLLALMFRSWLSNKYDIQCFMKTNIFACQAELEDPKFSS